ncbi:MAG: hypothetical protein KJ767_03815, partial [Nanoarchaeota archaeon]|nr:hypothetical protein [Nanoarchaeota archaeon]
LTITLIMFALILFSLSGLFIKQKQSENLFVQGTIERVTNLDASIQKSVTDLFENSAGISIQNSGNNIIIYEAIPVNLVEFQTKLTDFEAFVENKLTTVEINSNIQEMPLILSPKGIEYTHNQNGDKIIIKNINLAQSYEIKFTFPQGEEGACPITFNEASGDLSVKIIADDVLSECEQEKSINPESLSQATIVHENGNIIVTIDNNQIEISRSSVNAFNVQTTVTLAQGESIVNIKMPEIITNISALDFSINGEARFLT